MKYIVLSAALMLPIFSYGQTCETNLDEIKIHRTTFVPSSASNSVAAVVARGLRMLPDFAGQSLETPIEIKKDHDSLISSKVDDHFTLEVTLPMSSNESENEIASIAYIFDALDKLDHSASRPRNLSRSYYDHSLPDYVDQTTIYALKDQDVKMTIRFQFLWHMYKDTSPSYHYSMTVD